MAYNLALYAIKYPDGQYLALDTGKLCTEDQMKDNIDLSCSCWISKLEQLLEPFKNAPKGSVIEKGVIVIPGYY